MQYKIRDRRSRGWFWVDNDYLNGFAKYFGANGTAIYFSLCRHANAEQQCFPSQRLIAEELGIAERTVRKYLQLFAEYHLIEIHKDRHKVTQKWINNVYTLTQKEEWIKPSASVASGSHRQSFPEPKATNDTNQRQPLPTKKTNRKKTNIRKERFIPTTFNEQRSIETRKKEIRTLLRMKA